MCFQGNSYYRVVESFVSRRIIKNKGVFREIVVCRFFLNGGDRSNNCCAFYVTIYIFHELSAINLFAVLMEVSP